MPRSYPARLRLKKFVSLQNELKSRGVNFVPITKCRLGRKINS